MADFNQAKRRWLLGCPSLSLSGKQASLVPQNGQAPKGCEDSLGRARPGLTAKTVYRYKHIIPEQGWQGKKKVGIIFMAFFRSFPCRFAKSSDKVGETIDDATVFLGEIRKFYIQEYCCHRQLAELDFEKHLEKPYHKFLNNPVTNTWKLYLMISMEAVLSNKIGKLSKDIRIIYRALLNQNEVLLEKDPSIANDG